MGLGQEWEGGSRGRGTDERLGDGAKEEDTPPKGGGHQGVEQKAAGASRKAALAPKGGYFFWQRTFKYACCRVEINCGRFPGRGKYGFR